MHRCNRVLSQLQLGVSKPLQRLIRLCVPFLLDVPTRAFRAKVNPSPERHGRNESRAEVEPPRYRAGILDGEISAETEENTEGRPLEMVSASLVGAPGS